MNLKETLETVSIDRKGLIEMFLEALSALVLGGGIVKDKIEQNKPYYGTERDIFRNNERAKELDKRVDDIIAKHKAEYIKKNGHSW